ncbi:patatin-like phospholipase family protein [Actinomadura rayongensis]|uniref:Patatin-like phospholipase family protein n=1 Tax=Actinomadura rayongensis TaxID=1429076 RepID=A0A6I4W8Q5_9ACTN|nr:patatin-like phospholipase family protein [Actinomadura rayongensis]MXQ65180.1 patatin-like phospholipase family protein [Actinomadura rayongensis]
MARALVLGLGGHIRAPWQAGIIAGLRHAGTDLGDADVFVGTGTGAIFAALLAGGGDPADAVPDIVAEDERLRAAGVIPQGYQRVLAVLSDPSVPLDERRRRLGRMALEARPAESVNVALLCGLRSPDWPERQLRIPAVDTATGARVVFERGGDATLDQAVRASLAAPTLDPPVEIAGNQYMNGGNYSPTNADLAAGCDRVVLIAPLLELAFVPTLERELAALGRQRVEVVAPDAATNELFALTTFDPDLPNSTFEAGLRQAADEAEKINATWED